MYYRRIGVAWRDLRTRITDIRALVETNPDAITSAHTGHADAPSSRYRTGIFSPRAVRGLWPCDGLLLASVTAN